MPFAQAQTRTNKKLWSFCISACFIFLCDPVKLIDGRINTNNTNACTACFYESGGIIANQ